MNVALRVAAAVLLVLLFIPDMVAAQGRGRALGRQPRTGAQGPASNQLPVGSLALQPSPSFPQFGTWLDDATTADGGAGYASLGVSHWRGTGATQTDAPIVGVTYGITDRAQLSATVPFYRASYEGFSGSGLDNVYLSTKISVVDPRANGRFGVALGAVAEILGAGFADVSRAHWAVPLSMEVRGAAVRLYGSTGYFSRGAFFAAGAFEWTAPAGTSVTASIAHSASVHGVTVATTARVPRASLRDASVFVSHPVSAIASVYVGGSRSFSDTWIGGASSVSGGISFRFVGVGQDPTE
jgi:hypothetical protein